LGEKLNNKHPNSKMVLSEAPIVEDRSTGSTETKVRREKKKPNPTTQHF
jgi:hypothetical protein